MKSFTSIVICVLSFTLNLYSDITIDPLSRNIERSGTARSILTFGPTGESWTATTSESWISLLSSSGDAGDSCVYLVSANMSADDRIGYIDINGNTHTIYQGGYSAPLSLSQATVDLNGGDITLTVNAPAGASWSTNSEVDWVSISPAQSISTGDVTISVSPYNGVLDRVASLTIAGEVFVVTQTGTDVNISPKDIRKDSNTNIILVDVFAQSSTSWTVTPNDSWISVVDSGNGFGDSTVTLAIGTNPSYVNRTGTASIGSTVFEIEQSGNPSPVLSIYPLEANADPLGAVGNIAVLATPDAPWSAESLSPWIIVAEGDTGNGNGNIQYIASANPNTSERIGKIVVSPPVLNNEVDLTRGLIGWYLGRDDLSGWERHLENANDEFLFDGETKVYVNSFGIGDDLYHRNDDDFTLSLSFSVSELYAYNRLFGIDSASFENFSVFIDNDNYLKIYTDTEHTTPYLISANTTYHLVLTRDSGNNLILYLDSPNSTDYESTKHTITGIVQPVFPMGTSSRSLLFGHSSYPNMGVLNGNMYDIRIYNRNLGKHEIIALNSNVINTNYTRYSTDVVQLDYNYNGPARFDSQMIWDYKNPHDAYVLDEADFISKYGASPETRRERLVQHYIAEDSIESGFASEASVPGTGWDYEGGVGFGYHREVDSAYYFSGFPAIDVGEFSEASRGAYYYGYQYHYSIKMGPNKYVGNFDDSSYFWGGHGSGELANENFLFEEEVPAVVNDQITTNAYHNVSTQQSRITSICEFKGNGSAGNSRLPYYIINNGPEPAFASDRKNIESSALNWNVSSPENHAILEGALNQGNYDSTETTISFWLKFDQIPQDDLIFELLSNPSHPYLEPYQNMSNRAAFENGRKQFSVNISESELRISCYNRDLVTFNVTNYNGIDNNAYNKSYPLLNSIKPNEYLMLTLAAERDGVIKVYINNEEVVSTTDFINSGFNWGYSQEDYISLKVHPWDGYLDDIYIFDKKLNALEVTSLYNETSYNSIVHTVTQGYASASLEPANTTIASSGGTASVNIIAPYNLSWSVTPLDSWLSVISNVDGAGSSTVNIQVDPNDTVYDRVGTVNIAGQIFSINQDGLNTTLNYNTDIFGTDGGTIFVDINTEGGASWNATSDVSWLSIYSESGTGSDSVMVIADPYSDVTQSRTGTAYIAGKEILFTQRGYTLSVDPLVGQVDSNAGAREFSVAAPITAIWEAIATEPWITIIGGNTGLGSGTVRFSLSQNNSGAARTGKIIVSGEEYTLTQLSTLSVNISSTQGGTVNGSGNYDVNDTTTIIAAADNGYVFSHWSGDAVGSNNPFSLVVDSNKNVIANFVPDSAVNKFTSDAIQSVVTDPNSYNLYREDQIRMLHSNNPLLKIENDKATLSISVSESSELESGWHDLDLSNSNVQVDGANLEIEFDTNSTSGFYRIITSEGSAN